MYILLFYGTHLTSAVTILFAVASRLTEAVRNGAHIRMMAASARCKNISCEIAPKLKTGNGRGFAAIPAGQYAAAVIIMSANEI